MRKIKSSFDKNLFINYFIRIFLTSAISVLFFSFIFSFFIYKLDLDMSLIRYFTIIIVFISSILVSYISVKPFKNNGFILGMLSVVPLIVYSLINTAVNKESAVLFIIKLALGLITGGLLGLYSIKKSKKIRVK
ncbi:MAG: TIGR04086 family membrane protein [Clostridiales bacterium]|nr:TIGR04086 family membrane protein [Clostridiales bacterium]